MVGSVNGAASAPCLLATMAEIAVQAASRELSGTVDVELVKVSNKQGKIMGLSKLHVGFCKRFCIEETAVWTGLGLRCFSATLKTCFIRCKHASTCKAAALACP